MARMTKRQDGEIASIFYGINPTTLLVESVTLNASGGLVKYGEDGVRSTHQLMQGRSAASEVYVVWGLINVIEIPAILVGSTSANVVIEELEGKAAAMRATNIEHL